MVELGKHLEGLPGIRREACPELILLEVVMNVPIHHGGPPTRRHDRLWFATTVAVRTTTELW